MVKTDANVAIRGRLSRLVYAGGDYGESVGLLLDDAVLVEGVLMREVDSGYLKVFGWTEFENDLPEGYTAADAPEEYDFRHPQGVNTYSLVAARLVPDGEEPSGEEYEIGDMITFEGGSVKPKGFSRALVKTLASNPDEMVLSTDDIYNWLNSEVTLRPELEGREVIYIKYLQEPQDGRGNPFQMPQVIDMESGEVIIKEGYGQTFLPGVSDDEIDVVVGQEAAIPATDGGATDVVAEAPAEEPSSAAVDEFVTTMIDLQVDDEDQILAQLTSLVNAAGHDLSEDAVDAFGGESAVVDAILG
ncbi:hypothetical protein DV707_10850 [Halobellus limi]|uniref:Uncharacterized protein n=1 Tax=Halobellus limi TaxID=699433 RepID=A0A4D6H2R8_9EURY|nr:hypothetical protein DV707_10850 [Halobellus limi]